MSLPLAGKTVALATGRAETVVGVISGADGGNVGAAVASGDAALHPARSTTTAARPKPINRDTLREIKVQRWRGAS